MTSSPATNATAVPFDPTSAIAPDRKRTLIIGAGIVGSSLAAILSASPNQQVVLVDRSVRGLPGSTGHAPGYVGQYNELPVLTELARRSVTKYRSIKDGFDVVGGLEVASSPAGLEGLKNRAGKARDAGLQAEVLSKTALVEKAPIFIKRTGIEGGLFFANDGTANAQHIARYQQDIARSQRALLLDADVVSIGSNSVRLSDERELVADKIVLCTGIWTRTLLQQLPILPVAHPYIYTAERAQRPGKTPFVRYPEHHVYVRDHGVKDGLGSYAHDPIHVASSALTSSAYGSWESSFESVLSTALQLLPEETATEFSVNPNQVGKERAFNGLFSVTPDGKPLLGRVRGQETVYVASAIWVTHAAGCAQLLADVLLDQLKEDDKWMVEELDVNRFDGQEWSQLEEKALSTYNDIYNKGSH
ncbi:FAD dependent oxidoreductase [Kalmanozyma brasiliensis GHG001]|uniref:FAD dependent oxidoreductase domain-containing protein n=1 Tax=Kalmanozyma brasiliensis (strain GHG001) TaxID=1365824 RepID=V5GLT9_KALBG|nr:FAD dependent oxidoreductase [Kalmanozyma brasiliensis GHG001]EST06932.1 FAD dependent oxidoreductase [Kalmanozyma brasiliensis GHG001]